MNAVVAHPEDARTAFLPLYAEDTFARALKSGSSASVLAPPPDARLLERWTVVGTVVGQDRPAGGLLGTQTVFYAWLLADAASPGDFCLDIRGTGDLKEWFLDFEGGQLITHAIAGKVEYGFYDIAKSLRFRPVAYPTFDLPLAQGVTQAVGSGRLLITGHSLGSALANLASFELAAPGRLGDRVQSVVFASPRPGDSAFAAAFRQRVPNHRAYFWEHDVVPRVPFGFGYTSVPNSIELQPSPSVKVCTSPTCAHHALTYSRLIDPTAIESFIPYPEDQPFLACLGLPAAA